MPRQNSRRGVVMVVAHTMHVRRAPDGARPGVGRTQFEAGDADRYVDAGLAFETHRLQRKRIV